MFDEYTELKDLAGHRWRVVSKSNESYWVRSQNTGKLQNISVDLIEESTIQSVLSFNLNEVT